MTVHDVVAVNCVHDVVAVISYLIGDNARQGFLAATGEKNLSVILSY